MTFDNYNHFVTIVAGDNPDELMARYNVNLKVDKYVVFRYKDAHRIREEYIKSYQAIADCSDFDESIRENAREALDEIQSMTDDEFYYSVTSAYEYDKETGDAVSEINPNGKWKSYNLGKNFSLPFKLKDGTEVFQARKSDIDWPSIHHNNQEVYRLAWEMVMEGRKPETDDERIIYDNMRERTEYFKKFGTKENYVESCTAFWGFAFLSEETGWVELDDSTSQFTWMNNYFDVFIKNLPEDTLLTIYECAK